MTAAPLLAYQKTLHFKPNHSDYSEPVIFNPFNQQVLDYINEMRQNPAAFYKKYIPDYIKEKKSRFTSSYTHSLRKEMLAANPLPAFEASEDLEKTALLQLEYLSKFGGRKLTHEQGKINFSERMKRAGLHCLAENLYTADRPDALSVVIDLLIDQNVPSLGHRKNLLNPMYAFIGIVNGTPKNGRTIIVMDFGCKN